MSCHWVASCVRTAAVAALATGLSGCVMAAPSAFQIASYAADGASYAATGKSVTDHLISEVTAKDCAMKRLLDGEDVCKEREPARMPDGSLAPNAQDVALGVQPAGADKDFQSFAITQADTGDEDADEALDAPLQSFAEAPAPETFVPEDLPSITHNVIEDRPVQANALRAGTAEAIAEPIPEPLRAHAAPSVPVYTEGALVDGAMAEPLTPAPQPDVPAVIQAQAELPPAPQAAPTDTTGAQAQQPPEQVEIDPILEEDLAQDTAQDLGRDLGKLVGDDEDEVLDAADIEMLARTNDRGTPAQ